MVFQKGSFVPIKGCYIFFECFAFVKGFAMGFWYIGVENGTRYDADEGRGGKQC